MATKEGYTTIVLSKELKERLGSLKKHPRQSYEEVIEQLLPDLVEE